MGTRILLVEDEQITRERIKRILSQDQYTIVESNNGAEGYGVFKRGHFDLVILGFETAFIRGDELAVLIKQAVPQQPTLMISARSQRRGLDNPVDAVLTQSFTPMLLRNTVEQLLSSAQACHADSDSARFSEQNRDLEVVPA